MNTTAMTVWLLLSISLFAFAIGMAIWRLPWKDEDE